MGGGRRERKVEKRRGETQGVGGGVDEQEASTDSMQSLGHPGYCKRGLSQISSKLDLEGWSPPHRCAEPRCVSSLQYPCFLKAQVASCILGLWSRISKLFDSNSPSQACWDLIPIGLSLPLVRGSSLLTSCPPSLLSVQGLCWLYFIF